MSAPDLLILAPGLLSAQCLEVIEPRAPALLALLSRSRADTALAPGTEQVLINALLPDVSDTPKPGIAQLSAVGDGLITEERADLASWFRCDPCTLHADRDRLILFDSASLNIQADEASALVESLNETFAEDGMRFHAPHPDRWYLQWPTAGELCTQPMDAVVSRPVDDFLPSGPNARDWQRRLSEIQMLLHSHPINEHRMDQGAHCINSLWLWGEGDAISFGEAPSAFKRVISDDPVARGLAHILGIDVEPVLSITAPDALLSREGPTLLHLTDAREGALHGDAQVWKSALEAMDPQWFKPILQTMEDGRLRSLEIQDASGQSWRVDGRRGLLSYLRKLLPGATPKFQDFLP